MQHSLIKFLAIIAMLITSSASVAAIKLYQVELVVFQCLAPKPPASDPWVNNPLLPNTRHSVELEPVGSNMEPSLLPPSSYKLNPEVDALERSGKYKIILHKSWLQHITSPKHAKVIHIYGGSRYSSQGQLISDSTLADESAFWEVNGLLWISYAKYFDVESKLLFTVPSYQYPAYAEFQAHTENTSLPLISFHLLQKRRMKSNELNYFDHPIFGMLLKIYPFSN